MTCFTLARCIIAAEDTTGVLHALPAFLITDSSTAAALREALPYLLKSEADFQALKIYRSVMDVQYLISVIYHNLGIEKERDDAAGRHTATEKEHAKLENMVVDDEIQQILDVVSSVGAALAHR